MTTDIPPQQPESLTIDQALHQAVAHHQAGQLQDAERLYRTILQAQPNHPDANHNLGVLAVQVKQPATGLPHFKAALEANPNQGQYWLSYIDALIQTGQTDAARKVLEQGRQLGLNGEGVEALAVRLVDGAQVAEQSNAEPPHAFKESPQVPLATATPQTSNINPTPQEINTLSALFNKGQYAEAAALAQAMTERFPLNGFGWKVLGLAFKQMDRSEDALPPMQKAAVLSLLDSEAYCNLGVILKDLNRLEDAEINYRRALEIKPDYAEAHNNLGNTLQDMGRLDEAEASFRRALQIMPDYTGAHYNLGNTLQDMGQLDEAEASYRRALEIKPDFAEAHNNLANTLKGLGRLEDAEVSYRRTLEIKPDFAEAHNNLANTLKDLGRLGDAEASYRRALMIKPDYAEAHYNLGNTLYDLGRLDEAEASYRRTLEIKLDYAEAHNNLGVTLQDLDHLDEAELSYRQALDMKPDFAEAHFNLGTLLSYIGELDQEIAANQNAFTIAPQNIGLAAAAMLAVRHFLAGDLLECRSLLSASTLIKEKTEAKFKLPRAYWNLLDRLLPRNPNVFNVENLSKNMETLHVIGESHSLPAHGAVVNFRGRPMRCAAQLIAGCKQWHLGNGKANKYRYKFETIMSQLPQRSTILLTIGEIDCRPDEGIIKVWRKSPEVSLNSLCQATSKGYLQYVTEIGAHYGHQLVIGGVPAPNIPSGALTPETTEQHINLIRTFNSILRDLVLAARMDFLDVYALTDRGDGLASGEWHIDTYHLLPSAVVEAFSKNRLY